MALAIRPLTPVFAAEIAGILRDRIFHEMSPEDWSAVPGVHLTGYFNVAPSAAAAQSARAGLWKTRPAAGGFIPRPAERASHEPRASTRRTAARGVFRVAGLEVQR